MQTRACGRRPHYTHTHTRSSGQRRVCVQAAAPHSSDKPASRTARSHAETRRRRRRTPHAAEIYAVADINPPHIINSRKQHYRTYARGASRSVVRCVTLSMVVGRRARAKNICAISTDLHAGAETPERTHSHTSRVAETTGDGDVNAAPPLLLQSRALVRVRVIASRT